MLNAPIMIQACLKNRSYNSKNGPLLRVEAAPPLLFCGNTCICCSDGVTDWGFGPITWQEGRDLLTLNQWGSLLTVSLYQSWRAIKTSCWVLLGLMNHLKSMKTLLTSPKLKCCNRFFFLLFFIKGKLLSTSPGKCTLQFLFFFYFSPIFKRDKGFLQSVIITVPRNSWDSALNLIRRLCSAVKCPALISLDVLSPLCTQQVMISKLKW